MLETSRYFAFLVSLRLYARPLPAVHDLKILMGVHMGAASQARLTLFLCNIEWLFICYAISAHYY